jgi:HEAT repeat protein
MTMPTPTPMPTPMPAPMPMPMPRVGRGILLGLAALGLAAVASPRIGVAAQSRSPADMTNVQALLDGLRGTAPIPCALALTQLEGNGWGNRSPGRAMDTDPASDRIQDWLEHPITDPAVVPVLRAALGPGDACVRQAAARLLGRTQHTRAVTALTDALHDTDPTTRALGALGMGFSDQVGAYEPLVSALKDAEAPVRANAALALGHLGDHRAMPMLVPLLKNDRVAQVREAAALALGELD